MVPGRLFQTAVVPEPLEQGGQEKHLPLGGPGLLVSARFVRTPHNDQIEAEEVDSNLPAAASSRRPATIQKVEVPAPGKGEEQVGHELLLQLEQITGGIKDKPTQSTRQSDTSLCNENDYDTDLEMDENGYVQPDYIVSEKHDADGTQLYIRMCAEANIVPVSYFLRNADSREFVMRFHGLGARGTDALSVPLEKNTKITSLNLQDNDITSLGTEKFCQMLAENLYITELSLADNNIGSSGAHHICRLLSTNNRIISVNLSGNQFTDNDALPFSEMLQKNTMLQELILSHNKFGDIASAHFKDALCGNDTLSRLDLSWNLFRKRGAQLLSDGVRAQKTLENVGLKTLLLSMNGFGLEGAKAISQALAQNRTLQELDLSHNRIPLAGAIAIAKGLTTNEALITLRVGCNPLTASGAFCILTAVEVNEACQLKLLDFTDVFVNHDFLESKQKLMDRRSSINIIHGEMQAMLIKSRKKLDKRALLKKQLLNNPLTKMRDYMTKNGLRLIDFFKRLDKDQSMSLTVEEFRQGVKLHNLDLSEADIQWTIRLLDTDESGDIDFAELTAGEKDYKFLKRALLKEISLLEAEARRQAASRGQVFEDGAALMDEEEAMKAVDEELDEYMESLVSIL